MLADIECRFVADLVADRRRAVVAARRDLGEAAFTELVGMFWGIIETRPFMRATAGLADALQQERLAVHTDEAIALYEQMLRLNPNDNQGIRYPLIGCYLQRRRYENAAELLQRFEDDGSAVFSWAAVLLALAERVSKATDDKPTDDKHTEDRPADDSAVQPRLADARAQNPHAEKYFTCQRRLPRYRPPYYGVGDESEAIFCAEILHKAWKKHPKAKAWLKAASSQ
ncbi:MAG: tetratricopeptide repeat protein [Phycisphaerae bacterium]